MTKYSCPRCGRFFGFIRQHSAPPPPTDCRDAACPARAELSRYEPNAPHWQRSADQYLTPRQKAKVGS